MSKSHRAYLKAPQVLSVIEDNNVSCEQKIERIKNLLDGKPLSVLPSGQEISSTPSPTNTVENVNETSANVEEILSSISGVKEKQLATLILNEINRSNYVGYDKESFELIVANERIKFSNIKDLISFCISAQSGFLPLASSLFVDCLMKIRCPLEAIRNADFVAIRESLLKIKEIKEKNANVESTGESVEGSGNAAVVVDNAAAVNDIEPNASVGEPSGKGKKRAREEDEDEGESELAPAKKVSTWNGIPPNQLDSIRRSSRLKAKISEVWAGSVKASTTRKKRQK